MEDDVRELSSWVKTYTALKAIEVILILLWDWKSWEHFNKHFNRITVVAVMRIDLKEERAEADRPSRRLL